MLFLMRDRDLIHPIQLWAQLSGDVCTFHTSMRENLDIKEQIDLVLYVGLRFVILFFTKIFHPLLWLNKFGFQIRKRKYFTFGLKDMTGRNFHSMRMFSFNREEYYINRGFGYSAFPGPNYTCCGIYLCFHSIY